MQKRKKQAFTQIFRTSEKPIVDQIIATFKKRREWDAQCKEFAKSVTGSEEYFISRALGEVRISGLKLPEWHKIPYGWRFTNARKRWIVPDARVAEGKTARDWMNKHHECPSLLAKLPNLGMPRWKSTPNGLVYPCVKTLNEYIAEAAWATEVKIMPASIWVKIPLEEWLEEQRALHAKGDRE